MDDKILLSEVIVVMELQFKRVQLLTMVISLPYYTFTFRLVIKY